MVYDKDQPSTSSGTLFPPHLRSHHWVSICQSNPQERQLWCVLMFHWGSKEGKGTLEDPSWLTWACWDAPIWYTGFLVGQRKTTPAEKVFIDWTHAQGEHDGEVGKGFHLCHSEHHLHAWEFLIFFTEVSKVGLHPWPRVDALDGNRT